MQIPSSIPPVSLSSTPHVNPPKQTTTTEKQHGDTLKLSSHAKAKNLKLQGATNSEIANQLGIDVKTVNGYFTAAVAAKNTPVKA